MYNSEQGGYTGKYQIYATGDDWEMAFENTSNGFINLVYNYGFTYKGVSGDTIVFQNFYGNAYGSTLLLKLTFEQGDASFDGLIDVSDVQATINYMFDETGKDCFNFSAADLWKDGAINVQDVVKLVELLFTLESVDTGVKALSSRRILAHHTETIASLYCADGNLILNTPVPVAALDVILHTDTDADVSVLKNLGFIVSTRATTDGMRIIAYSFNGVVIPAGENLIATTHSETSYVVASTLTDHRAHNIPSVPNKQLTTEIGNQMADINERDIYLFDMMGRKVTSPRQSGIYIRNGRKIVVK